MKWCGTKKELPTGPNPIQRSANLRDVAILSFINNSDRELLLLLLSIFEQLSELFYRAQNDLRGVEAKPGQIAPESRNQIGSGGYQRRFPCLESNCFCSKDRL